MATSIASSMRVARAAALRSAAVSAKRAPLVPAGRRAASVSVSQSRRATPVMAVELDFDSKVFDKELIKLDDQEEVCSLHHC